MIGFFVMIPMAFLFALGWPKNSGGNAIFTGFL